MKRIVALALAVLSSLSFGMARDAEGLPSDIYVEHGTRHIQGIAFDAARQCMYMSFTTSFLKTDLDGKVIGSIDRIQGHLGAMVFNPSDRKVYASLECKDDAIGQGLSDFAKGKSMFYIAIIDVDRLDEIGMDSEDNDLFRIVCIKDATRDYHARGGESDHAYGCSGIDGVTIAPAFGKRNGRQYLYVAYGIYGDNARTDNDHQVLLRYSLPQLNACSGTVRFGDFYDKGPEKPLDKYFVFTGNTTWGIQNLAFDAASGNLLMAVYRGKKARFANYDMFCVGISTKPSRHALEGVPYDTSKHKVMGSEACPAAGFHFKYGSTGICALGDGLFYISENGKNQDTGKQCSNIHLYKWTGNPANPFERL